MSLYLAFGLLPLTTIDAFELSESDLQVGGYVDGGRFQLADTTSDGEILNRMGAKWTIDKKIDEHWSAKANLHWMFWRNQATDIELFHIAGIKFDSDVQGSVTYQNGSHRVKGGLYEFKYNPDSKNLGEYLLRSEAYPTIIENSQGKDMLAYSHSRVAGVEYGLDFPLFRQTGLIYAEQFNTPVNDVSLAYLAAVGPEKAELGLGVAFHRQFRFGMKANTTVLASNLKEYIEKQGLDTKAVKVSLRGRLDFGAMGAPEGFRIYGEAALLGLKNDSLFYKHMAQRLPVMVGMDLPTGGWLNTLSLEVEYFKNPYLGRKYLIADANGSNFSPLPFIDDYAESQLPNQTMDDWKWSLLAHKGLNRWIDLKVRLASDHLRLISWNGDYEGGEPMTQDTWRSWDSKRPYTLFAEDWYLLARIEFHN